ncbi:MAG: PAS domain-containing protein [Pseudomonadota bacterium]|nr:PAS domain-containing protein [Pseudomonadota bacterium]
MPTHPVVSESHFEYSLSELTRYPDLFAIHRVWKDRNRRGESSEIGIGDIPATLLPTVMLIEMTPDRSDATIRLAGTFCCELHGGELRGKSVSDFFLRKDAEQVIAAMNHCIDAETPSLAERQYVTLDGDDWGYVRLLLPQPDKDGRKRLFKAMDRSTIYHLTGLK